MKLGAKAESPREQLALALGLVPTPLLETYNAMLVARCVMVAVKIGLFEALASRARTAAEVAARCDTDSYATSQLLVALAGAGYVQSHGEVSDTRFTLAPGARRWLLAESPLSLRDAVLFEFVDAAYIAHMEEYVRTGEPLRIHETMSDDEWALYQRGMRAGASLAAPELALRIPMPRVQPDRQIEMLDIGGAHGYYSVALCRRHPRLRSTILDLPAAVAHAAPLLAQEHMGDRVVHRAGNALTDDLGEAAYDLVLIANLVHHFDDATNRELVRRVARALRPGGILVIGELIRLEAPGEGGEVGALTYLYFAITSEAGTYSFAEMADWQRAAGLVPRRPLRLFTAPGAGLQIARKPRQRRMTHLVARANTHTYAEAPDGTTPHGASSAV